MARIRRIHLRICSAGREWAVVGSAEWRGRVVWLPRWVQHLPPGDEIRGQEEGAKNKDILDGGIIRRLRQVRVPG